MSERTVRPVAGTVLADRYRLLRRRGVGGMGEVWEAEDDVLERRVAVKLVRDIHLHDPAILARFEREAQTAARLAHARLATVYDYGASEEGAYLVMELLEGETLAERLRRGALPPAEAAEVVAQAADALTAAHADGVVHRDMKPSNVMLTDDGVKVMDFGIASGLGDPLTATGVVIGTANYLAPERVRGDGAGPESDVYALGAVLFEALTGTRAFDGATPVEVSMAHLHQDAPDPAEIDPTVPAGLAQICREALAKAPEARPTVADLAARLRGSDDDSGEDATTVLAPAGATDGTELLVEQPPERRPPPSARPERTGLRAAVVVLSLVALLAAVALALVLTRDDDPTESGSGNGPSPEPSAPVTTAAPPTPPTAAPTTAPPPTSPPPAPEPEPDRAPGAPPGRLADAAVSYVETIAAGDMEGAWALTSPAFQAAQDRSSWEGFWDSFDSVEVAGEPRVDQTTRSVVLPLQFDGRNEDYPVTMVPGPGGTWLVDGPVGR